MLDQQSVSHYRIRRTLELAGTSEVYEAEDTILGRRVLLRVLAEHLRGDRQAVRAFLEDARKASRLDHPNISSIFEVDLEGNIPFVATEYLSGKTLTETLAESRLPVERCLELGIELCEGLEAAHAQGIVHGDICPANLFLTRDGQLKILRFQSGQKVSAIHDSVTRPVSDERRVYLAPERAAGRPPEARGDLFSAGAVLYEAVTGQAPFRGPRLEDALDAVAHAEPEPVHRVCDAAPPSLATIVARALEKDPELRYQSAADMRSDLRLVERELESGPLPAAAPPAARRTSLLIGRKRTITIGAALALLAALFVIWGWRGPDTAAASAQAHLWLQRQQSPSGWVASYRGDDEHCYTYDQAMAALAFLARNDADAAGRVLAALKSVQNGNGSWYAAYSCRMGMPRRGEQYVGPAAWVVLAVAQYRRATGKTDFDEMSHRALRFCLQFQQPDGGVNGGLDKTGRRFPWASTEHNLDLLHGLRYFGYRTAAAGVETFLEHLFDESQGRFLRGRNDPTEALDVLPLGVFALGPGAEGKYLRGLDYALRTHRNRQPLAAGWFARRVEGFHLDADKSDIWSEGTAQMALALRVAGREAEARHFLREVLKMQESDGGLRYSIHGVEHEGSPLPTAASVASTAWLILALENRNPMQP
jgi:hypothetical protein